MFKKILVPSDGSDLAHKAADFAADLAKVHGAQVIGIYVIDPFPYIGIGDASAVGLQAYLSEAKLSANRSLEVLAESCRQRGVAFAGDTRGTQIKKFHCGLLHGSPRREKRLPQRRGTTLRWRKPIEPAQSACAIPNQTRLLAGTWEQGW